MEKAVIDTNIYIDWINKKAHEEILFSSGRVKYLSAIVLMELYAGAHTSKDKKIVEALEYTFAAAERLLLPAQSTYAEAGEILAKLQKSGHSNNTLSHDILIALSARQIGATLFTRNKADFHAIRKMTEFKLQIIN